MNVQECSTKFCSYVSTDRVFKIALRGIGFFPQRGEMENFAGGKCFFFGRKQQPQTKNKYLYTGIINTVFQRFTISILYISFILPWICPRFHDVSYMILNSFFFQKIEKATFTNQFNLLIFFLGSKLFFSRFFQIFLKIKKSKKGLKNFARIKLWKKGKLKLGKI